MTDLAIIGIAVLVMIGVALIALAASRHPSW